MQNDVFFSFFHTKKLQKTIGHITGDFSKMMCPIFIFNELQSSIA